MHRSHLCNQLRASDEGQQVELCGWVHRRRDHGGLIFIDLRDREGLTQIVVNPETDPEAHKTAEGVRSEYVLYIKGTVHKRPDGMQNQDLETGEVEVLVNHLQVLNPSETPPFEIDQDKEVNEELRLEYRYLDIRRERLKNNIIVRHKIIKFIRDYLDAKGFIEIETPILIKGTPEGSREYIVPSRLYPGKFFVLPQSPQQLKQLLMVAGMDKYFQIARCFRDEDQRGDRQPEFTQLDMEMSFINEDDILAINEGLIIELLEKMTPEKKILKKPLPRLTWDEAMNKYGSDKPDLRFEMPFTDVSELVKGCGFQVFAAAVEAGGVVKALRVPGGSSFSRKDIDELTEVAKIYEAKGLAYIIMDQEGPRSAISKFLGDELTGKIVAACGAQTGDAIFFTADAFEVACIALGHVRLACAKRLNMLDPNIYALAWITDFPLLEWNKEESKFVSSHHPFTSPKLEDVHLLDSTPEKARSRAYDLTMNGSEVGGGSIRIHSSELQSKVFDMLGISKEDAQRRFGHMLRAFKYGAPPHGGIAWGLDRLIMIMRNEPNIREVIPFPKDQKAKDLLLKAPSELPKAQVAEMHVEVKLPPQA